MKLLDEKGLTTVWAAIKNTFLTKSDASSYATKTEVENAKKWVSNSFMLLTGGTINGGIDLIHDNGTAHTQLDAAGITVYDSESDDQVEIHINKVVSPSFRIPYGTGDQVLVANGYTKEIGSANGIAGLDSNGYVPLDQLGNLDTTVAEVVATLPTTNIKKHIYLIKDANGTTQNQYAEYIYTGDTSATYDSSKWEKLGTYTATVDLTGYAKNKGVIRDSIDFDTETPTGGDPYMILKYAVGRDTNNQFSIAKTRVPFATTTQPGIMSKSDKVKLDGIASNANNYSLPLAATSTRGGIQLGYSQNGRNYPVQLSDEKAYVNVPWTNTQRGIQDNLTSSSTSDSLSANQGKVLKGLIDSKANSSDLSSYPYKWQTLEFVQFVTDSDGEQTLKLEYVGGNTTYRNIENANPGTNGFMSKEDKVKLDKIQAGANNYTLPTASNTTLGGIKVSTNYEGTQWPISVDENGIANTYISGLEKGIDNGIGLITIEGQSKRTCYSEDGVGITYKNSDKQDSEFSFPSESGTFALTSDISDLCKINFVDRPSNCKEGRINMFTTTDRSISLNNIQDYGKGLILLLGCYSDSQYTIYCTDSDLYYKGVLVDSGYRENITREGMYLVTIKGTSVYVYPLG